MNNNIVENVNALNLDDLVWYVYIFIAAAALYSNFLEKEYIVTNDKRKLTEFHTINIVLFTIAFIIYIYFLFNSYKKYNYNRNKNTIINVIASILFLVGGGMLLYLEIVSTDEDINEIAI